MGEYYDALIGELGRRYVQPTGKSTSEAINEILMDTDLLKKHGGEQRWDRRPYVALDDLPQNQDVENASAWSGRRGRRIAEVGTHAIGC